MDVLIEYEKILNIILFFTYCVSFLAETQYLKYWILIRRRRRLTENIFHKPESSFLYPYFVGLAKFLTNVMSIVSHSFYSMINKYSIGPTVVKSVDVEPIRHRSNSDTETNDNPPIGVIFEEWEELQDIATSALSSLL